MIGIYDTSKGEQLVKDSKVFTHGLPSGPRIMPFRRDFLVVAAAG
jgi:hypothetical protein